MTPVRVAPDERQPFFTPKSLGLYLALSERTIREMLRDGTIPSYKIAGARRIAAKDVDRYLERHRDG